MPGAPWPDIRRGSRERAAPSPPPVEDARRDRTQPVALSDLKSAVPNVINRRYFLNSFWIHDTDLVDGRTLPDLLRLMDRFPICRTNDMGIMNIYFAFMRNIWRPLEVERRNGLPLIDWTERDGRTWRDYIGLKYARTIVGDGGGS
jgi:hypothetical protein